MVAFSAETKDELGLVLSVEEPWVPLGQLAVLKNDNSFAQVFWQMVVGNGANADKNHQISSKISIVGGRWLNCLLLFSRF